jgi:hypothetical protein
MGRYDIGVCDNYLGEENEDLEDFNGKTVGAVNSADSSSGCLSNTDCEIPSQYKSPSL